MARFTMAANATLICQMPQAPMGVREVSPHAILIEFLYVVYEIKVLKSFGDPRGPSRNAMVIHG